MEEEDGEGFERKPSKISFGRGAEAKVRRKGTLTHIRESIRSSKGAVEYGRSDIVPRKKSTASQPAPDSPDIKEAPLDGMGGEVQLEMVTVGSNNAQNV